MINLSSQSERGMEGENGGDREKGEVVKWPFCPPLR